MPAPKPHDPNYTGPIPFKDNPPAPLSSDILMHSEKGLDGLQPSDVGTGNCLYNYKP